MTVTFMTIAMLALQGGLPGRGSPEFWTSLFRGQPGVEAVEAAPNHPGVDLANPLGRCERLGAIDIRPITSITVKLNLGRGRQTSIDVWITELSPGDRADQRVLAAGVRKASEVADDWQCTLSKRGLSLIQVGRYWIGLPTLCRRGYYKGAVSSVLAALRRSFQDEFPDQFIFGPCGKMLVQPNATKPFVEAASGAAQPRR